MINIGITGGNGFLGSHVCNALSTLPEKYNVINFRRSYFEEEEALDQFVRQCDVVVHLAGLNRHKSASVIYEKNIKLISSLISSFNRTQSAPHVIMSSSLQEKEDNSYGESKKTGRLLLAKWAKESNAIFSGLIIPNIFGPFGKPHYNSVVATFCDQLSNNECPKIDQDSRLKLIYVSEVVSCILNFIDNKTGNTEYIVEHTAERKVSEILELLQEFKSVYQDHGEIPRLRNSFELNLFNTYRSFMDLRKNFPRKIRQDTDSRGSFAELIRLGIGGQVSFSTTMPGVTRGNHFHTRKIERFVVIKGKALIQLRRINTDEIISLHVDGNEPTYVDIPIWHTHNIKNIGDDILYTNFWINETYNPEDTDTYFQDV